MILLLDSAITWWFYFLTVLLVDDSIPWLCYCLTILLLDSAITWRFYFLIPLLLDDSITWVCYFLTILLLESAIFALRCPSYVGSFSSKLPLNNFCPKTVTQEPAKHNSPLFFSTSRSWGHWTCNTTAWRRCQNLWEQVRRYGILASKLSNPNQGFSRVSFW